ncbi:DNase I-like protein [Atractiella rhizophila]|nr:DNase I-like protein [Atractiella rhizophila]
MHSSLLPLSFVAAALQAARAVEIVDINGPGFISPYAGQTVQNITGVVTAKSNDSSAAGFWIKVAVGDLLTGLSGKVQMYRSSADYTYQTELSSPSNFTVVQSGITIPPVVIGAAGLHPPTQEYTSLDLKAGGILAVPNNQSQITAVNPPLQPSKYGLDFWESLKGKLVTITNPIVVGYPNSYGEFWVRGDYPATGINERGGLTITKDSHGYPDLNPEAIVIGGPLDNSNSPDVWIGSKIETVTGIVTNQFGFYRILPLTKPVVISHNTTLQEPTTLVVPEEDASCTLVFGDYNVENMYWNSVHLPTAADQITQYLRTPDIVFLQEIQDDTGPTNDGVTTSNRTLTTFTDAIFEDSGVQYDFTYISPEDGKDGGQPGGNIRVGMLYRSDRITLAAGTPGTFSDTVVVSDAGNGKIALNYNPGLIDLTNDVYDATRKPLVSLFEMEGSGAQVLAINVHMSSKGGSTSIHGDARPPVNLPVDVRIQQVNLVADFVESVLTINPDMPIIVSGDFNEYGQTTAVWEKLKKYLVSIDEAANIHPFERYTYVFDMNHQQLDHAYISSFLAPSAEVEHLHVNNWVSYDDRTSDHDPSVSRVKVC